MSVYIDRIENDKNLPITYSINIKTLSTSKRPLTCYITTTPRTSNQLNYFKPSICLEKSRDKKSRSSIHLPVTYSTSIHVPCHPPTITQRSPIILPSQSSHHHYHHYHHHYYHHHHRQPLPLTSRPSTTSKQKISPRPASISSTRLATTSTTTMTPPDSSSSPPSHSKPHNKNIHTSFSTNKQSPRPSPPPLPSYSALVWNWFHHTTPTKPSSYHKGSQSDYSETYRHELPNKRSLLFKLLTSPIEKQSKSKSHRPCFTRKRLESSSSLPNKCHNYYQE